MERYLICGGQVVRPNAVEDADLLIEDGRIAQIAPGLREAMPQLPVLEAEGGFVMPGIVDMHTDAIEREVSPRPSANFPVDMALQELDQKMLACGITTVYHSTYLGYHDASRGIGGEGSREGFFRAAAEFARSRALANTKIHLRFEITGTDCVEVLERLIADGTVDLLSFMDHTPGQGQCGRERFIALRVKEGMTEEEAAAKLAKLSDVERVPFSELKRLAALAREHGIVTASHDDDSPEKVRQMQELGVAISEFPITLEAAREAERLGMHVLGGSTNYLRGGSLTGNLSMQEAVEAGALHGFCSDYYPPSILHAVFKLWTDGGRSLPEAAAMASLRPAQAVGISDHTGSIETGKDADLIIVARENAVPKVRHTLVRGRWVHHSGSLSLQPAPIDDTSIAYAK